VLAILICIPSFLGAQEIPKYRIDPVQAYGGSVTEYFKEVEYIPLETTNESLFGEARKILITGSSIVVYDYDTRSSLFFTANGKFLKKIKEKENTYSRVYYDQPSQLVIIITDEYSTEKQYINYYSEAGIEIRKVQAQFTSVVKPQIVPIGAGYFASGSNFYLWNNQRPVDSSFGLIKIYRENAPYKSLIPYNQKTNLAASIFTGSVEVNGFIDNGTFYIGTPLENEIYKITKDTAIKSAKLIFPFDQSFTEAIIKSKDRKMLEEIDKSISGDTRKVLSVGNILFHNNLLFFKINTKAVNFASGSESNTLRNFIYDTKNGKLVSFERINSDLLSYYLPITSINTTISGFVYFNGSFFTQISSLKMFAEMEKNKSRNPQYPSVLREYFRTQTRKSNPVIVKMKLK
jgi:hypothetical protein